MQFYFSYLFIPSFSFPLGFHWVNPNGKPTPARSYVLPTYQSAAFHLPTTTSEDASSSLAVIKYPRQQLAMSSAKQILYYSTMEDFVYKTALPGRDFVSFTLKARFVTEIVTQIQKPAQHLMPCHRCAKAKV